MNRRTIIRAGGAALGGLALGTGRAAARHEETEHDNYEFLAQAPVPGAEEAVVEGQWAYVAHPQGMATVDLREPTLPKTRAVVQGAGTRIKDVKADRGPPEAERDVDLAASADDGGEGVTFFDVSEPAAPERLATYVPRNNAGVHNLFLRGDYAYLCINEEPEGAASFSYARMVIVDVSDPTDPTSLEGDQRGSGGAWMLRDVQPDMAKAGINPIHDLFVQECETPGNGPDPVLAYCCFWDAGLVVVNVSDPTDPFAVDHFGAVEGSDEGSYNDAEYLGAPGNAHYTQPTPDGSYTFVGAETFPVPGVVPGRYGGIRAFDTRDLNPKRPFYGPNGKPKGDPFQDHVAFIPAPDRPTDAVRTSHNFDVTGTKLFASFYQGGVRAYDITPTLDGDHEDPEELAAFAPPGGAFWTAENVDAEQGTTYYTVGSDIGKGLVVLELNSGSHKTPNASGSEALEWSTDAATEHLTGGEDGLVHHGIDRR